MTGHEGPILCIDLSVKDQLASSSGDGTIRVWNLGDSKVIKTIEGLERVNEFQSAKVFSTPSFNPKGELLAYPKGKLILVVDTVNWEMKFKLENDEVSERYSVSSFSYCGKFVAAGTVRGEMSVWNTIDKSKLKGEYKGEDIHGITSLAWNPNNDGQAAFCDADGQLSSFKASMMKNGSEFIDDEAEMEGEEAENDEQEDFYAGVEIEDDEDADNENCVSIAKLKNETLKMDSDSDGDDDGKGSVKSLSSAVPSERLQIMKKFALQPPFQPGSTPTDLEHRFMTWNHVGQVVSHAGEENSIIAEFHDVTIHPSLHILNTLNHEMASLSTTCLALATKDTTCRLVCIALVSAGSREWSVTMPECEEIQAIAAGETFVAAATDARVIRFFTTMGTQREVVAVPGTVVAMTALENKLAVAYHTSDTSNKFSLMIFTLHGLSMTNRAVELPVVADKKLTWLGFSDMGSIVACDSSGRVTSYNIRRNLWIPICDLMSHTVGASDNFFIISVSEKSQKIRATLCRGTSFPHTNPRPIVRELDYALPLCYMETEKSKLEEALVRANTFKMDGGDRTIIEKGLKLFSSAMNSELEARAFEIIELIGNKQLIESAAKYASQKGRIHMSNKILKLLSDFEDKQKAKDVLMREIEQESETFSETYEIQTPKITAKHVQETSTPIIAPKPMISQKFINKFKKNNPSKQSNMSTNSLNHLMKNSIGYNESTTVNSDDENTPTNNVSKVERSLSLSLDTPRPGNFSMWFVANKQDLLKDYPEKSDKELMKIGKDLYLELTKKQKLPEDIDSHADSQNVSVLNKRKLNLTGDDRGGSKLAKFGFDE